MMKRGAAFLWDESFLWGIMAYRALKDACLPFELVCSDDIRKGCLERYSMLFVPGGWSSNKMKALGDKGAEAIRDFVKGGGSYLGFCGGAGLATIDGIGLLNIKRMPTKDRVPSFSGRIRLKVSGHGIWQNFSEPVFYAWWPPQIEILDNSISVLASYDGALPDAFSSDLNVGDIEARGGWKELEAFYRINLDPKRLLGEPAVVEGRCGRGRVLLSLVHFDTVDDGNGRQILQQLWKYLSCSDGRLVNTDAVPGPESLSKTEDLESDVSGLVDLGIRNFLWFWRTPMLLQWRRGVRGLEYCTLYIMIRELSARLAAAGISDDAAVDAAVMAIGEALKYFIKKAERLLVLERLAMQGGQITYERCDDPDIRQLRDELFSSSKSYGGLFKELIDRIDALLYVTYTTR